MREGTDSELTAKWARVGRRIQVRRARLGLSQGDIKGVTRTTVSRVERGTPVGLDTLARIEGALGFDEEELINEVFGESTAGGDAARPDAAYG